MGNKYDYDIGTVIAITLDSVLGNGSYERLLMVGHDVNVRMHSSVSAKECQDLRAQVIPSSGNATSRYLRA